MLSQTGILEVTVCRLHMDMHLRVVHTLLLRSLAFVHNIHTVAE